MDSFEFKWSKNMKPEGSKAIKLKNIQKKANPIKNRNGDQEKSKGNLKIDRKIIKPQFKEVEQVIFDKNPENPTRDPTFIKRKGKKDKLKNNNSQDSIAGSNVDISTAKHHSLFSEKYKNVHINPNVRGVSVVEKVFSAGNKFGELNIHKHIISNLEKHKYTLLTNVQEKSIPEVLSGKNCLIRSQTGSGKTLTYAVPILNTLVTIMPKLQRTDGVQAIVVVPTRELALQTHELFSKLNGTAINLEDASSFRDKSLFSPSKRKSDKTFQWIIIGQICGGENRKTEKDKLRRGVHVLIGTPGRLLDHMLHTAAFNAKHVRCLVLDEADRLLDMGFKKDIVRLVEEIDGHKRNSSYDPLAMLKGQKALKTNEQETVQNDKRQTLLLSATLTKGIAELADFTMKEHVYIDALDESATTNPEHMIIPNTVKQEYILTFVKHRLVTLSAFLISKAKQNSKTFVFMATSQMVEFHYGLFTKYLLNMPLNKGKLKVGDVLLLDEVDLDDSDDETQALDMEMFKLHGSMTQQERKAVFNGFRKAKKGILLCTDIAARGIDVPEADCIVQYTGPQSDEDYLHRVGRTGRAGKSGSAIIFLTHEEQDFIPRLQDHKVFLKEHDTTLLDKNLIAFMDEPDKEKATLALQRRYETAIVKDKELHRKACFAYSSWSRFYSGFPIKMKSVFDLKKVNIGHYVTSFGLQESPTTVARIVRGQATKSEPKRLNKKLANHMDNVELKNPRQKRPIKSLGLTTSEFSSGLAPARKKQKKN